MLGFDFARTLRAAQAGEEDAFVRLWRDANPAMVRYLRVVGHDDPYDEACEGWLAVVRGLPAFTGDENDWRRWVFGCARQRAEEGSMRRARRSGTGFEGFTVEGDSDLDLDEVLAPFDTADPSRRGIADTLTALRALPLGQGEVVVLRLGAELPPWAVAEVVGVDEVHVERAHARGLERLATAAELVSWSLAAPPSPAELADERVALSAFRTVLSRARADSVKVIAVGTGTVSSAARPVPSGRTARRSGSADARERRPSEPGRSEPGRSEPGRSERGRSEPGRSEPARSERGRSERGRSEPGRAGGDGREVRHPGGRGVKAAGRSRTAALAITALSLSVVSLGGFGAAAYVGVLPTPVQQAMHDAVGAPAPGARGEGSPSTRRRPVVPPTTGLGPSATSSAAAGLCRAWSADKAKGTAAERSVAYRNLSAAAGGAGKIQAYCTTALAPKPSRAPTASVGGNSPATQGTGQDTGLDRGQSTGKDTGKDTGQGTGKGTGKGSTATSPPRATPSANPRASGATSHTAQGKGASSAEPTEPTKPTQPTQPTQSTQPTQAESTPQSTAPKGKKSGRG